MNQTFALCLAIAGTVLFFVAASPAQATSLESRVVELEQRVSELETKIASPTSSESSERPLFGEKWKDIANWRKLQIGMTQVHVRQLMGGEPDKIARISSDSEIWYFGYPGGGRIELRDGRVES